MKYAHYIFIAGALIVGFLFAVIDAFFQTNLVEGINIFGTAVLLTLLFLFQYYWKRRNGEIFGSIDKQIFKIILAFLKTCDFNENEIPFILKSVFKSYSQSLTDKLYKNYINSDINLQKACFELRKVSGSIKLFVFYALFDIASKNKIISKKEEEFILKIGYLIHVPSKTIHYIKQQYIKKGISSEKDIENEQKRKESYKKKSKSFLLYNAYKTLGVSPSVTKSQLKKVYRILAKKYHPDKYHGQNEEIIQKMESKFHEIAEAYEIVKKNK